MRQLDHEILQYDFGVCIPGKPLVFNTSAHCSTLISRDTAIPFHFFFYEFHHHGSSDRVLRQQSPSRTSRHTLAADRQCRSYITETKQRHGLAVRVSTACHSSHQPTSKRVGSRSIHCTRTWLATPRRHNQPPPSPPYTTSAPPRAGRDNLPM